VIGAVMDGNNGRSDAKVDRRHGKMGSMSRMQRGRGRDDDDEDDGHDVVTGDGDRDADVSIDDVAADPPNTDTCPVAELPFRQDSLLQHNRLVSIPDGSATASTAGGGSVVE
jgi:hypothetical protein